MSDYIVEMKQITKRFPGIVANDQIDLLLKRGEIHALLGENGAGKSTLMSILFGFYQPDEGQIFIDHEEVFIKDPNEANRLGIGMVHQHFKLVQNFSVLENIVLGAETTKNGILDFKEAKIKVMELSQTYGLKIEPDALIQDVSVAMQQRVEILKMLYRDNHILIFDEPTAVLTPQEIKEFMNILINLKNEGKSILFITHKLDEIKQVAETCTIIRRGKYIDRVEVATVDKEALSEMMVGRKIDLTIHKQKKSTTDIVLECKNISLQRKGSNRNILNDINFTVKAGEIVCLAGVDGNGQSELVNVITGLLMPTAGSIYLKGHDISKEKIRKRNVMGLSHIPEDRQKYGLVLEYNLSYNLILQSYFTTRFQHQGFLNFNEINNYANQLITNYDIRSGEGPRSIVKSMSGGNQQKAIIGREIDRNPELIVAVQPTRGLDVGAINYVHKKLVEQRNQGRAVFLISFDLDEVMNLSDRILVIYEGEIVANLDPDLVDYKEIGLYMAGAKKEAIV